jgi:hypothetical protein
VLSPGQAGRVKIARCFNGGNEICEKKQDFEARRNTEDAEKNLISSFRWFG